MGAWQLSDAFTYGGRGADARTVLVFGNCQAPYLARMLAALDDLNDDYRFVVALNHPLPGEAQAVTVADETLRDVALVVWQFEDRTNNPAAHALRARLPAACPEIRFPTFLLSSPWPFECIEPPRGAPEAAYPWTRYPLGDMIGLEVARMGLRGPLAVAAYLDLSAQRMPNLHVRLERDFARMGHHDAQCDVRLADYVEANYRREHLFWTNGHVSRAGVVELARRVADAARPVLGGSAERARQCFDAAADFDGMGGLQLPIHPLVASTLELAWCELDQLWRWYDQRWNYFEYIERYISYDTDW